jgi:hypothetical protein
MSLEVEHLGIEPFVDEKPDQLIRTPAQPMLSLIASAAASGLLNRRTDGGCGCGGGGTHSEIDEA